MKDCIKIVIFSLLANLIVGGIVCCGIWVYECETQYQEYTYTLEELEEDVYGIYQTVVSSIPAQNYTMITICCDGNVKTIKGVIQICYTEERPKITIKDYNCYKNDEAVLYVPNGSIEFIGTMRIS